MVTKLEFVKNCVRRVEKQGKTHLDLCDVEADARNTYDFVLKNGYRISRGR